MTRDPDFLYDLLPVVYRLRDADQGYPLRALLRVVGEQAVVVEQDIAGLYENWFIETCDDWVVPYIGALVGWIPLAGALPEAAACACGGNRGCGGACACAAGTDAAPDGLPSPRRDVAGTIAWRRRKGTRAVLEEIAPAVSGWPAHAVEFRKRLAWTQNIDLSHLDRGHTVDVRRDPDWRGAAFDSRARTVDIRRVDSRRTRGVSNIDALGLYVWRQQADTITLSQATCCDEAGDACFLFDALGHDVPLVVDPAAAGVTPALPFPIKRRALAGFASAKGTPPIFCGPGHSFAIWTGDPPAPVDASRVVAADLTDWTYRAAPGTVAVDPELGRFVFPAGELKGIQPVRVSYAAASGGGLGGGEYLRGLDQLPGAARYTVGAGGQFPTIGEALARWTEDAPTDAVIEIVDSDVYTEPLSVALAANQTLQLRAADRHRPVIRVLNWRQSAADRLEVSGEGPAWFQLDGIVVTGRGLRVSGTLSGVTIRHCTLVPGWGLDCDCTPRRPDEPSIDVQDDLRCLRIVRSITGAIRVARDEVRDDPLRLEIADSIVDALGRDRAAVCAEDGRCAHVVLCVRASTIVGQLQAHRIDLAVDSILDGLVRVCRRQSGCIRFCHVRPGSTTPRRYECQPDLVERAVGEQFLAGRLSAAERDARIASERLRVAPEYETLRYGTPGYARLTATCALEILRGAEDESEIGAFHRLQWARRESNLAQRLAEFTPARTDAGIIHAD